MPVSGSLCRACISLLLGGLMLCHGLLLVLWHLGFFSFWLGARIAFGFRLSFSDFNREGKFPPAFVFLIFIVVIVGLVGTVSKALDYAPYHSGAAIFGSGGSWYGDPGRI